jgi:carbon monoxide dehydrogenase subunit G
MAVKVTVDFSNIIKSPWDLPKTFGFFSQLEKAIAPHFPGLESFTKTGENTYRWTFENVKYASYEFQIKFTTKIHLTAPRRIEIKSTPQPGDSDLDGGWELKEENGKTVVHFDAKIGLELPIPFFLKSMATPVTQKEISKLFDRYITNVSKTISQ